MKRFFGIASMLVVFAAPVFASNKPVTVTIPDNVQVGSTPLAGGDYKLTYTGSGSDVQVTLTKNAKAVITFQARLTEKKNSPGGVTTQTQGSKDILESIQLDKVNLELEGASSSGQ